MLTVGVVIPYYNHSEYVNEAVESLLAQTALPDRIVLVDDSSAPAQCLFAADLCKLYDLRYIRHPVNLGPSTARNTGIRELHARQTDIVICLDADDVVAPGYIQMMVDALDEHPEALVAYPDVQMFGFESRVVKAPSQYYPGTLIARPFIVSGAAFRTEMWVDIFRYNGEGWDTTCDEWGWEDYLFWMEGLLGVAKGDPLAAVHAGPNKFWYLYRRFKRPDRSDGNEQRLWDYMAEKMRRLYGVTLPPVPKEWRL